jgi:vesicle-fusing ATPase
MNTIDLTIQQSKYMFGTFGHVNNNTYKKININKLETVLLKGDNNIIINLKIDDSVPDDYIGIGQSLRSLCSYMLNSVNTFVYLSSIHEFPFPLEKITMSISPINTSETKEVDCEIVITQLKKAYINTSINLKNILGLGTFGIKLSIDKMTYYENDDITDRTNGYICGTTEFDFIKIGNIKLINKKSSTNNQIFNNNFNFKELDIGGLDNELTTILRRVFISRMLPLDIVTKLNISHVKGLILYGPPGTGKTLIARKLSKCLKAKSIQIINGPELLSKFIGETEKNIRELFAEAESDMKSGEEGLHVIVFDEFDSVAVKRGSVDGISGDMNNKIVTQLLSKIDGVDALNNILLIGMTNRLDMLDSAILRPGRFEIHVEINLPSETGRKEILQIHTKQLYIEKCIDEDVDLDVIATNTKNYTGAELEGLVKDARSYAINEIVDIKNLGKKIEIDNISVTMEHFRQAVEKYVPKFGTSTDNIDYYLQNGIQDYSEDFVEIKESLTQFIDKFKFNKSKMLSSIGIYGLTGSGKTAFSVWLGKYSTFPYIKIISNNDIAGYSESNKNAYIKDIFEQSYLSENSVIVLDSIDTLIEFHRDEITGTLRFMNSVYSLLRTYIRKIPTKRNHKLLVIINTEEMSGIEFNKYLDINIEMPGIERDGDMIPIKNIY